MLLCSSCSFKYENKNKQTNKNTNIVSYRKNELMHFIGGVLTQRLISTIRKYIWSLINGLLQKSDFILIVEHFVPFFE